MISLGTTRLADYSRMAMLGKGTYGEVYKCMYNPTQQIVAIKTFLFEVSSTPTLSLREGKSSEN